MTIIGTVTYHSNPDCYRCEEPDPDCHHCGAPNADRFCQDGTVICGCCARQMHDAEHVHPDPFCHVCSMRTS